ncbi:MAG: long-chain-fatty-acid--CoA ligase [Chloroflexi bacterium]|nr:long-chain-fatty-acid--CoA ligase [Chloroflexota bacterium]MDA1001784.1 long-chain-fatty-acid--CoA ligase [Chloroflexota bacterium]
MEVPLLVNDFLRRAVKLYGESEAVVDGANRFSYAEYGARCYQLGHALQILGVKKGDRVGILSPNSHHFLEAFYGTASIGAVLVPLNYRLIAADFEYCLQHAGASVILADSDLTESVDAIRTSLPDLKHFVVARYGDAPVADGWTDWETLIAGQPTTPPVDPGLDENDLVSINYTSGTTARPKGVMLTHRNFYVNAYNYISHFGITHDDVDMWTLPLFHCNGWGGPYALTAMGAKHVIVRAPNDAEMYEVIEREGITFACMAPAVLARILEYAHKDRHNIKTKPRFVIAGAPPPLTFVKRLEEELGWTFIQIYGLTETAPILTIAEVKPHLNARGDQAIAIKGRAGQEGVGVEIRVLGEGGEDVPWDDETVGEVCARGNMVFKGYWNQPDETAKAIVDGYFHTGDLATINKDGYINIVDRAKDVIISGGENVSSIEVEDTLYKHPAVLEAAVIGVPHEQWGETPLAAVVLREGAKATDRELIEFCRERMAHFKAPTRIEFVSALPRTATGKLKKFELREEYWGGKTRRVN